MQELFRIFSRLLDVLIYRKVGQKLPKTKGLNKGRAQATEQSIVVRTKQLLRKKGQQKFIV